MDVDEDEAGVISTIAGINPHLEGVEDAVKGAVVLNYVKMLRYLAFYIRKGRTCDLSFLCDRCIQEPSSRRKKRSYSRL